MNQFESVLQKKLTHFFCQSQVFFSPEDFRRRLKFLISLKVAEERKNLVIFFPNENVFFRKVKVGISNGFPFLSLHSQNELQLPPPRKSRLSAIGLDFKMRPPRRRRLFTTLQVKDVLHLDLLITDCNDVLPQT